jgi:indole-3-glycerol phosphate synthase
MSRGHEDLIVLAGHGTLFGIKGRYLTNILDQIVSHRRREVEEARVRIPEKELKARIETMSEAVPFRSRLLDTRKTRVIAEIKKASPSAGLLRPDFDPVKIAQIYVQHGAAAMSVLTDEHFFQGSLSNLRQVRETVSLPLLRKDFIIDSYQLLEARVAGADAVLLIAEVLSNDELPALVQQASSLGLQSLVELYDEANLNRVLDCGCTMIGVNNRDLRTFETRLDRTLDLAPRLPQDTCLISESGIRTRQDIVRLERAGVAAVLVGETLMTALDIGAKLDELRGASTVGST